MSGIRVELPAHLRRLAGVADAEVTVEVTAPATLAAVVDALEARFPALSGTIRDYRTGQRRALLRFFACGEDVSHQGMEARLPEAVARGEEALIVIGAVAGG